jgi:ATP-GRASP peptide maturase of grasp-with-spasm system
LFNPNIYKVKEFVNFDNNLYRDIVNHIIEEKKVAHDYIQYHFENIPHIGTYSQREVNKLIVLTEALRLGINIPATFLACNKKVLVESESINAQNMITKSISEAFSPVINNTPYVTYTESVNALTLPNKFELSLFQEKIEKEADIRVFYILGDFYSMSIMSQNNNQTETDFRKYDKETPNRKFSFSLPKALTLKLDQLMKKLKLETGSIDLVFTKSGDFIFLEVNPVGQFGMTSYPCNYFLEKIIGKKLTQIQLKA